MASEIILTLITCPDEESASKIAKTLVENSIAACINIVSGVRSVYIWDGMLVNDDEMLLIIKSPKENLNKLKELVLDIHPYDTPEIVSISPDDVDSKYEKWVLDVGKGPAVK